MTHYQDKSLSIQVKSKMTRILELETLKHLFYLHSMTQNNMTPVMNKKQKIPAEKNFFHIHIFIYESSNKF